MNQSVAFQRRIQKAIADPNLQVALDNNAARRRAIWQPAFTSLPNSQETRRRAREIRQDVVRHLDQYLEQFIQKVSQNGIQVHATVDSEEACRVVVEIAQSHNAGQIAKSKSMLTEEIGLNQALEAVGIRPVETDLGEFIVQLRGEKSTHIITPAVHLRREDVARTFEQHLNMPYTIDVEIMNAAARAHLRDVFLNSPIGVSGVNFGVVETGTLCLIENEGNIRMVTTLPPVHIALMGVERLVPSLADLAVMLQVLPRAATGQKLTSYLSWINASRQIGDLDGPSERHLVLVDNNRMTLSDSLVSEVLLCIRCGACLNACPVYQEIGGASYESVYPGPIGSLVSPGLLGLPDFGHLAKASTLCGACVDACPVSIDFPTLLQRTRVDYVQQVRQPRWLSFGLRLYAWITSSPKRFRFAQRTAFWSTRWLPRRKRWLRWLPFPLSGWTRSRHFPSFSSKPFRDRWAQFPPIEKSVCQAITSDHHKPEPDSDSSSSGTLVERFSEELGALAGEFIHCTNADLPAKVTKVLAEFDAPKLLVSPLEMLGFESLISDLEAAGAELLDVDLPMAGPHRVDALVNISAAHVGLTRAIAALADTGTVVQPGSAGSSRLASLLPPVHIAILSADDIFPTMADWLDSGGGQLVNSSSSVTFITGPSRTADIEMTLTIGVHGPGHLIVFCLE